MLNAAFVSSVLCATASGFRDVAGAGLPLTYCYLALPLVLHSETRERLPITLATKLVTWTERNGDLVARLPMKIRELIPYVSPGILVAGTTGLAVVSDDAQLTTKLQEKNLTKWAKSTGSHEVSEIIRKAIFLGKWFAAAGSPATVFTAMGVRFENDNS